MTDWYWNTERDHNIICPYCGEAYTPSLYDTYINDEYVECYEEKEQTFICDRCRKKFKLTPYLEWKYETETIDGEMTEEEHEERW